MMSIHRASQTASALRTISGGVAAATLGLALVLGTAGCGGGDEAKPSKPSAPAKPAPPKPTPPVAKTPPPAEPATPARVELGDAAAGAKHYAMLCSSCHGAAGAGDGPVSAGLNPKPAAHTDGAYMNALSNEHLFKVIKHGGTAVGKSALMAPWGGTLDDAAIADVVAFVRSLADPPYTGP